MGRPFLAIDEIRRRLTTGALPTETGCLLWRGSVSKGYGVARLEGRYDAAHRVAYAVLVGPVPDDMCVLHRCDVPLCVNPDHLWLGTKADNNRDCRDKERTNLTARRQRTNLNRAVGRSRRTAVRTRSAYLMHLLRKSYGLTQRQLAHALGDVAIETVTRWESGAQVPGPVSRRLLAHLLGCEFLVDWDETPIADDTDATMIDWVATFRASQSTKKSGAGA